jgi:hypothetical protein
MGIPPITNSAVIPIIISMGPIGHRSEARWRAAAEGGQRGPLRGLQAIRSKLPRRFDRKRLSPLLQQLLRDPSGLRLRLRK